MDVSNVRAKQAYALTINQTTIEVVILELKNRIHKGKISPHFLTEFKIFVPGNNHTGWITETMLANYSITHLNWSNEHIDNLILLYG